MPKKNPTEFSRFGGGGLLNQNIQKAPMVITMSSFLEFIEKLSAPMVKVG